MWDVRMKGRTIKVPEGPFQPTWESLEHYVVPEWYLDAKFGIFIHWGLYSVPAFRNEWYSRNMYLQDQPEYKHHLETYGPHKQFGYKDFIPKFTAEKWNPEQWADLFKKAGVKHVVLVAEHHDGFALYDCSYGKWNAVKMGPKRDVVGELSSAVHKQGLVFGVSYHRAEHWWFFEGGMRFDSDVKDPKYADFYGPAEPQNTQPNEEYLDDWLGRACEIVDKYHPQLFYFDWWIEQPAFKPYLQKFTAYYYNRAGQWDLGVAINYKHNAFPERAAVLDVERGKLGKLQKVVGVHQGPRLQNGGIRHKRPCRHSQQERVPASERCSQTRRHNPGRTTADTHGNRTVAGNQRRSNLWDPTVGNLR
jgi:alpha-L-fucosidase